MHNILYLGKHYSQRFSPSALSEFSISKGDLNVVTNVSDVAIVIVDVCQCKHDPLASASHAKSYFNDERLVFLMLYDTDECIENEMCYREGFDESLCCPSNDDIEIALLKSVLLYEKKRQYLEKLETVESMARMAIYNSSELGVVVRLLTDLVKVDCIDDFALAIVEGLKMFELHSCVQIRLSDSHCESSSCSVISMMERKLLMEGAQGKRIASLGRRSLFNEPFISILIKNMPDEEGKRGRINDHVATIIHASNSLLKNMDEKAKGKNEKQSDVAESIVTFKDELININENIFQYSHYFKNKILLIRDRIYESSLSLDLTDVQIEKLNEAVRDADQDNEELDDFNIDLEMSISNLEEKIKNTLFH